MNELIFIVEQESDGGYVAEAVGESIVTQGDDWNELQANVRDAVESYFFDSTPPASIRLRASDGSQSQCLNSSQSL